MSIFYYSLCTNCMVYAVDGDARHLLHVLTKKLFASLNTKRQATAVNDAHTHTLTIKCQAKAASECGRDVLSLSFRSVFD